MKKIFFISLFTVALSASAQNTALKVQSDGKIAIQTNSTALSPISINSAGSSSYYMSCNPDGINGINLSTNGNGNNNLYGGQFSSAYALTAVGLKGSANYADLCAGLMGYSVTGSKTIGIVGATNQSNTSLGAGVYGTVYGDFGTALSSGVYAGFFYGNVKVTGSIITGSTIQGALLGESAGESGSSGSVLSSKSTSVASALSGLNVTTYQKERPEMPRNIDLIDALDGDTLPESRTAELDVMEEQFYKKIHYALDADRLEELFPDLVYVREDGSKAINYMEMIPLLVQSINELSAKIEVLEGQTSEKAVRKARSTTDIQGSVLSSQNKLYQNTPNPFKEQTIIRFSLADDAQDAAICIFDMQGKMLKKFSVSSGTDRVTINCYELGQGMFLYSLVINGQEIDTKRMVISK